MARRVNVHVVKKRKMNPGFSPDTAVMIVMVMQNTADRSLDISNGRAASTN